MNAPPTLRDLGRLCDTLKEMTPDQRAAIGHLVSDWRALGATTAMRINIEGSDLPRLDLLDPDSGCLLREIRYHAPLPARPQERDDMSNQSALRSNAQAEPRRKENL